MKKKVVFDVRTTHKTGIYRYILGLLSEFGDNQVFIDNISPILLAYTEQHEAIGIFEQFKNTGPIILDSGPVRFTRESEQIRNEIYAHEPDLYYTFHYTFDKELRIPCIFTIHDLLRIKHPQYSYTDSDFIGKFGKEEFTAILQIKHDLVDYYQESLDYLLGEFNKYFYLLNKYLVEKAKMVVTVSQSVSKDIQMIMSVSGDKLFVASGAVDKQIFNLEVKRYESTSPYLLFVGLAHKHKRFDFLLSALSVARSKGAGIKLIVASNHLEQFNQYKVEIDKLDLSDSIEFITNVGDEMLASLYKSAKALVISSIDEGFCLPMLEAFTVGANVIAPDLEVMRECSKNSAIFYNPDSVDDLSSKITYVVNSDLQPVDYVNTYSWTSSANTIIKNILKND